MKPVVNVALFIMLACIAVPIIAIAWTFGAPVRLTFSKTLPNGQKAKIIKKYRWFWLQRTEIGVERD